MAILAQGVHRAPAPTLRLIHIAAGGVTASFQGEQAADLQETRSISCGERKTQTSNQQSQEEAADRKETARFCVACDSLAGRLQMDEP